MSTEKSSERWPREAPHREPVDGVHQGTKVTHPAFATASFSRISGGNPVLFGSKIRNMGYIRLSIHQATLYEDTYGHDRVHAGIDSIVEVNMTEAQFVSLITNMNRGSGTPVTLSRWRGPQGDFCAVPMIEHEELEAERQRRTVAEVTQKNAGYLRDAGDKLRALVAKLPKKDQAAAEALVSRLIEGSNSNLAFASESLKERMENMLVAGQQEIDAFVQGRINALGVKSLDQLVTLTATGEDQQLLPGESA